MEEFVLAEWELPSDCEAPLVAPADATVEFTWRERETVAKVQTVRIAKEVYWVFFQPRDESSSNYIVVRKTSWPIKPHGWETRKTSRELSRIVRMATNNQQFSSARFFYLGEPQNAVAFFSEGNFSDANGAWVEEQETVVPFKIRAATKAWDSPRLYDWLLKMWRKPDSEVRFAWQWSQWSEKQRHQWLYPEARGLNELVQVMNWALQSEPAIGNDEAWRWYLHEYSRLDDPSNTDNFGRKISGSEPEMPWKNVDMQQKSPRLWALRQFFVAHFLPLPPMRIAKPPICVRNFDELHRSHIMARREIQSAEAQLEATLNLRDWLQKHDAPAELLALLSR